MDNSPAPLLIQAAEAQAQRTWRIAWPALVLLLGWVLFWYRETAMGMVAIWYRSETFAHGFVVLPIVAWLVWRQRRVLAGRMPKPNAWLLLPLAATGFLWLLGELASANAVTQAALTATLILAVVAVLGPAVAGLVAFPLGFLFFAVPAGEFALPWFMEWTADFTVLGLKLTGIPVYREGLQFVIPSGNWSVVEACSGVRYLIASLMVGTLFAYLNYRSLRRRMVFILVSAIVPIVANWVRAYMIVMLGHLSGNRLAVGVDHLIYGWIFFGFVIMLMFVIGARWSEDAPLPESPAAAWDGARPTPLAALLIVAAVAAVTALPPLAFSAIDGRQPGAAPELTQVLARPLGGWQLTAVPVGSWQPQFREASAAVNVGYQRGQQSLGMFIAYYRDQGYDRKLVASTNVLVKSEDPRWAETAHGQLAVRLGDRALAVRTALLRGKSLGTAPETKVVAWQWYWINGHMTASDAVAKGYLALSRLLGQGDDSAVIVLYAETEQPGGASAALEAFAAEAGGALGAALDATRVRQ